MNPAPLSYDSLKTVLQYIEANRRPELSRRIPSLLLTDRATPLVLDKLILNPMELTINKTTYKLSIYRKSRTGRTPEDIVRANEEGSLQTDVDQYGWDDIYSGECLARGDIRLRPFLLRRRNDRRVSPTRLPGLSCDNYIQLVKTVRISYWEQGPTEVERVFYTKKLFEAMRYLTTQLFGNRKHPITIRNLAVPTDYQILRLPVNLKFNVGKLKVMNSQPAFLPGLSPLLHRLDTLKCAFISEDNMKLEVVKAARSIVIPSIASDYHWMLVMHRLENQNVVVKQIREGFETENYISLAKYWIGHGKKVGTCCSFEYEEERVVEEIRMAVIEKFGGLSIPMRYQDAKLVIKFERKEILERIRDNSSPWVMKMEVVG